MRDRREEAYRVYVTDCLKLRIGTSERYADWIRPARKDEDERTADEVKNDIRSGIMALRKAEETHEQPV